MEVEYSLTLEDMTAFARYHQKNLPKATKRIRAMASLILFIVVFALSITTFSLSDEMEKRGIAFFRPFLFGVFAGASVTLIGAACSGKITLISVRELYKDEHSRWMFARGRLIIDSESISFIGDYQQTIQKWSVVWKIAVTDGRALLYISMNMAHVVPRRAFRDREHFEEFIALARHYQQCHGHPVPKSTGIIAGLPPQSTATIRPDAS